MLNLGDTRAADRRPGWAREAGLPSYEALSYVQTLLFALVAVIVAGYMASRVATAPRRGLKALRRKTGV